ncbi:urea transporter [Amphritea sp.]|uniref:urea transporter n=1 Tax=Amphritea sp. TaxID=1872502 RepID=UPI003D13B358
MVSNDACSWPGLLWRGPFLRGVLSSFSQIMLQNNRLTGVLLLIAVVVYSPVMAVAAILGCVVNQLFSLMLLRRSSGQYAQLEQGLYGFNGALVGLAMSYLWPLSGPLVLMLTMMATLLATIIGHCLKGLNYPLYTLPFILSVWLFWLLFGSQHLAGSGIADVSAITGASAMEINLFRSVLSGIGQVMFLNSGVSGALLLAGLLIVSRVAALVVVFAVILSLVVSMLLAFPIPQIALGIYSYNVVLLVLALLSRGNFRPLTVVCGVLLAVLLTRLLQLFDVMPLTAPFVLSVWVLSCLPSTPVIKRSLEKVP